MTTLIPALTNALSGLVTAKGAIDTISNNIANVNTAGYTRKIVQPTSITLDGQGSGVQLAVVERLVDLKLQKDILQETGVLGKLDKSYEYYQAVQDLFGNTADNNSVSHLLQEFQERLQTLATSPTAAAAQYEAVQEAESLATRISSMSEQLQYLRVEADRAVETCVGEVNDAITRIKNLNDHIQRALALGKSSADLEDQRDVALTDLAQLIDIRINPQSDGTVMVFTNNGRPLVDQSGARLLTHTSVDALSAEMTYAGDQIDGITWNNRDLTGEIQEGQLKALIDMRDSILPNLQSELDTLTAALIDGVNQMHNRGVAYPTLQGDLEGTTTFIDPATQRIAYSSGDTVVALVNSTGSVTAQTTIKTLMAGAGAVDADGGFDMASVASAMQTWLQAQAATPAASVSFDSAGKLVINLNSTTAGIAFHDIEGAQSADFDPAANVVGAGDVLTLTAADGTVSTINFAANRTLAQVAADITALGAGYTANVVQLSATTARLVISTSNGEPFTYGGTASIAGKLDMSTGGTDAGLLLDDDGNGALDQLGSTDIAGNTYADHTATGFANFLGINDLLVNSRNEFVFDSPVRVASWRYTPTAATDDLTFTDINPTTGAKRTNTLTLAAGTSYSLQDIADAINADATLNTYLTAAVVPEGNVYRLRITHVNNGELVVTGNAVKGVGLEASAAGAGLNMSVRDDLLSDPSLLSRGSLHWNDDPAYLRFELSEGDNSAIRAMVEQLGTDITFSATGNIGTGNYTYTDYAAALLSINARGAEVAKADLEYQQPLNEALEVRHKNLSGVNLDEEMASLIVYQQAYSAAARVITVTQKMMEILENLVP